MANGNRQFGYVAVDPAGRRVRGSVEAHTEDKAFERLKHDGLSPIRILSPRSKSDSPRRPRALSDREAAEFLSNLSALLGAGTDMRTALGILGAQGERSGVRELSRTLAIEIGGGSAIDAAFAAHLGKNGAFVAALISAGDLVAGLQRSADMLKSRVQLQDQLITVLSYPGFVFLSTIAAMTVILLFVIPSLAPLVEGVSNPPVVLSVMIAVSSLIRSNASILLLCAVAGIAGLGLAARLGTLAQWAERILLDGPASRTASGLVFGAFAIALGNMLIAGSPMSEALRLAIRSVRSRTARDRLEPVVHLVRQGQTLSSALETVKPFPATVLRLSAVGEASGALGPMLARAGKLEEDAAIRRIEAAGRILGPALIVALGAVIGLMMAGLLSGVSQLGQSALQ